MAHPPCLRYARGMPEPHAIQYVEANGLRFAFITEGEGPLALLLHGFPDTPHTWDHVRPLIAAKGYRVVTPFMRGYRPTGIPSRDADGETLARDAVELIAALGEKPATLIGHDWGAPVAWHAALLRPDRFRAVIGLSVPFIPRGQVYSSPKLPESEGSVFYQQYFQDPGIAEADLEHDVRATVRASLFSISGDAPIPETLPQGFVPGMVSRRIVARRYEDQRAGVLVHVLV